MTLELGMDRQAAEIRQLQRQQEKPKWFPSLGKAKQDEHASEGTEKVTEPSSEVTNAAKKIAYDETAMSESGWSDDDGDCSVVEVGEGVIMGAVSDFLDEERAISLKPRYSKSSLPWPSGSETGYRKGSVLDAVDYFLDGCKD